MITAFIVSIILPSDFGSSAALCTAQNSQHLLSTSQSDASSVSCGLSSASILSRSAAGGGSETERIPLPH